RPLPPAPPAARASPAPSAAPASPAHGWPRRATLTFTLYKGTQGLDVGQLVQSFERTGNRYALTQVAYATGIFALFKRGRFVEISDGTLTAQGLRPDAFWIERGQSAATTDSAQFDWHAHTLTYGSDSDSQTVPLAQGTQDLLSFAYQLAFLRPRTGLLDLTVTDGRSLSVYRYRVVGVERIATGLGRLKTWHLARVDPPGDRRVDIWLAERYGDLPVKVRLTDKSGDSAEEVVQAIRVDAAGAAAGSPRAGLGAPKPLN
ncbi:MAG: DUF3108 domain-containing protein, partial [Betaproteobacteria bacterium]|nr:DUF3108 domain-containing protein [Betaproteobacteria bacterium]